MLRLGDGLFAKLRDGSSVDFPRYIPIAGLGDSMPVCTQNVKKRKTRRIKNDRLQAAKKAAQAKV
jgi:hypothetical protein